MALAFAGKAVAAAAISAIVRKSFEHLEKYVKAEGMKSVKERLERTLPQVQLVFDAIDMEQIKDHQSEALDTWLWQLRDAVEEAEDVLDEVEYYKLEEQVKTRDNKVRGSLYQCKRKFVEQFSTTFQVGTFKRLMDAMKVLDEVAKGVERFIQLVNRLDDHGLKHRQHWEVDNPRETSSFLADDMVIGRNTERDHIVESLIEQASDDQTQHIVCNVAAFAIVGIGGMGKTTLAQAIYHDERVKQCFDTTMWVCVSDFSVETLTRQITEEMTRQSIDVCSLNTRQQILKDKLSSKKFLLVFDDVWNDERRPDWEKLVAPLKFGQKGSKILLTTRMQSVVDIVSRVLGGETKSLRLDGLGESDLLALFNKHAFFGVNPDDYKNLQEIGKQIAKKLSGSPLAAKVMGGLLNNSMDSPSWNRILKENICNIEYGNEGVMKVLRLSYHHLPTHLQACFRYCSIFKEDYQFGKNDLVNMWMGAGLIQQSIDDKRRPEDIGQYYIDMLTKKSFFVQLKPGEYSCSYVNNDMLGEYLDQYYVMHDLLHELACSVSTKECIRVTGHNCGIIPKTIRHMSIVLLNHTVITDFYQLKKLRTLIVQFDETIGGRDQEFALSVVLKVAKKLRVLRVKTRPLVRLPDAVGNLIHLRYLSLPECWTNRKPCWRDTSYIICNWRDTCYITGKLFPQSVYKLYHLQMIDRSWFGCTVRESEMDGMSNLVSLRHLNIFPTTIRQIRHIGNLISLQELVDFAVQCRSGYTISELQKLKELHNLHVRGLQNVRNVEEATAAKLDEKEDLITLSLQWGLDQHESRNTDEQLLNNLRPHTNLAKLQILGYNGSISPCWLESTVLVNLTYIGLFSCQKWEHLPPLGQLSSLKSLYLSNMQAVKKIDCSFYGCKDPMGFPSLKELSLQKIPQLDEWIGLEGRNLFPQLDILKIRECQRLRTIPTLPPSLTHLLLEDVGLVTLPAIYQHYRQALPPKSALSLLLISNCPNLVTLEQEYSLVGLEELHIRECENLLHLPAVQLGTVHPCLENLAVVGCPKLMGTPAEINLPSTMRKLCIGSCGVPEASLLNSLQGLTSLTTLLLHDCAITVLPSAEVFGTLTELRSLMITGCKELSLLDGVEALTSLRTLAICGCVNLIAVSSQQMWDTLDVGQGDATVSPSKLDEFETLQIDHLSLLLREPLRSLCSVRTLTILGDSETTSLPEQWLMQNRNFLQYISMQDAVSLQSLPPSIASLASLRTLYLHGAELIQSLPALPASLVRLHICPCHPVLETRCRKSRGPDWRKIAHIQTVEIRKKCNYGREQIPSPADMLWAWRL